MSIAAYWFILGLFFLFMELAVPGFVIFFFGVGAIITAAMTWLLPECSLVTQGLCFSLCSILSLVIGRFWIIPKFKRPATEADADPDGIVGSVVEVVAAIEPPRAGRVLLHGSEWTATADRPVAKGAMVTVTARNNITLTVHQS